MPRQLLILRHAKSSWDSGAASDFERPLGERGERDAPRMGEWLNGQELKPDHIISSPAERARQTILAVCEQLGVDKQEIHWDERIYGGSTGDLLQVLAEVPDTAETVMLVGHNPGLENLVLYLCGESVVIPANGKLLPTAALARMELTAQWQQLQAGNARKLSVVRPKDIC
jgi:phosphohistidine phosphatase